MTALATIGSAEDFPILTALRRRLEATGDGALTPAARAAVAR